MNEITELLRRLAYGGPSGVAAGEELVRMGAAAVPPLCEALASADPFIRETAAWALGRIRDPNAASALRIAAEDVDPSVRRNAIWALGHLRDPEAVEILCRRIGEPHPGPAQDAFDALARIGVPAVGSLGRLLVVDDVRVRLNAVESLQRIGVPETIGSLIRALHDPEFEICRRAACALGCIAAQHRLHELAGALPRLEELFTEAQRGEDSHPQDFRQAIDAIRSSLGPLADLPIPAGPHDPSRSQLPRPVDAPRAAELFEESGC